MSGFAVDTADDGDQAFRSLREQRYDVVIADVRMPRIDGMELLVMVEEFDPQLPIILLTGHGDIALAVEAMRRGAHDFLEKPYDADHLVAVVERASAARRMSDELIRLRNADAAGIEGRFVGTSPGAQAVRARIEQLKDLDIDVLIRGETGTGKEVAARALHDFGRRGRRPFVAINCAAIPETVFESEMFGHHRGAFTGASDKRVGKIEYADGGTVLLDEIESMPLSLQAKMLRVIQERVVEPLGGNREVPSDVRFIAASKVDLKVESEAGRFRSDLYFRLSTVELHIPPLRNRREDIAMLFKLFVAAAADRHKVEPPELRPATLDRLSAQNWPGNVRELKAAAERFSLGLAIDGNNTLGAGQQPPGTLPERLVAFETQLIREALEACGGSTQAAATRLGIPVRTLNEKIARYGVVRAI
ncbi:sigma-54-dependent Fis family transcriptional regulator [Mesorhizobium albiziae]|nr:sigma-54-dependent Fis family transcriptional regulator [Mesorhizobium albiziae]